MYNRLFIGGVVLIIIAAMITPNAFLNFEIHESKEIVSVKLLELPNCSYGGYKNKFLTIEYNGSKITLKTSCKYVKNFHAGQQVKMFCGEGINNFVFPNEDVFFQLISGLIIGLLGIVIVVLEHKKNR